jgi:hypothetical protein
MLRRVGTAVGLLAGAFCLGVFAGQARGVEAQAKNRIFEIRTYTAADGKLDAVVRPFRDPEKALFEKYGMPAILYSTAAEPPLSQNTFVNILAHESREPAKKSWAGSWAIRRSARPSRSRTGTAVR